MRNLAKWYGVSLAVHLGLLALMLAFTVNTVKYAPPISIDFTLSSCPVPEQTQEKSTPVAAPKQPIATQKLPAVAAQPTPTQQEQARPEPPPTPVVSQNAAPAPSAPLASRTVTENVSRQVSTNQGLPVVAAAPRTAQTSGGGMTTDKAQQRYLKEHFTDIRDLIVKRLSYPLIARRMGWSGRVVLAFIVAEDGSVRSIQVKESSGYPALDNSAMETVKSVAPFPRPPAAAEIVMPVQFQLR